MVSFQAQWPLDDQGYLRTILNVARGDANFEYAFIPFWVAVLSAGVLLAQTVTNYAFKSRQLEEETSVYEEEERSSVGVVARNGGAVVFSFMLARLLGCATLVAFWSPPFAKLVAGARPQDQPEVSLVQESVLAANVYALLLASAAITSQSWRKGLIRHNISVLLAELGVYSYRNVWPLATYTKQPLDLAEGWLMWAKLGTLAFTVIVIPLFIPSVYTPIDPKRPEKEPHPEQTASLFSYNTYSYLTPVIEAAAKVSHLPASELPPLADYDRAEDLAKRAAPYLSPSKVRKGRHIVFRIVHCFSFEYFKAMAMMTIYPMTKFLSPLAVNRLLTVLESGGEDTTGLKPWVWIVSMLFAAIVGTTAFQYYIVTMTHALAHTESILTQLVFDYSLRVRVKAETSDDASSGDGDSPKKKSQGSFIGRLTNLVTIDLNNIVTARDLTILLWDIPIEIVGSAIFLYALLGWSALVGLAVMVVLLPVPGWLTSLASGVEDEKMKKTDDRTQTVTGSMNVLRMIKMFGWEGKIQARINERREEELKWVWKGKILELLIQTINFIIPTVTMLTTYATATLVMKIELTAAKVFSSMILFDTMRNNMMSTNFFISMFIRGKVSVDRLNTFFKTTDVLDAYDEEDSKATHALPAPEQDFIGFRNATFSWSPGSPDSGTDTPSSRFNLTVPNELSFAKGKINLIVGATGSGKTSLLMALLGEMHFVPTLPDSAFSLPRAGGVSFAVQESWVLNQTIRDNIVFGSPYDEERYKKVLYQCALEQDLEMFEAGDQTEVGERGLTLSGGQKARLTLARAIYSKAAIVLLDDVLAALDVHTAKWIVNKCFKGELVKDRTVLLVTHNVALASPLADLIVSVSPDGVVTSRGKDLSAILASEPSLKAELEHEQEAIEADEDVIDPEPEEKQVDKKAAGKLILAEEIQEGNVGWKPIMFFLKSLGGDRFVLFFTLWIGGSVLENSMSSFNLWFLGYWSSQYERFPISEIPVLRYMGVYAALTLFLVVVYVSRDIWVILGQLRASRTIHQVLSRSILGATLRWLDETPVSRVIQRMTLDINSVDGQLMRWYEGVQTTVLVMIVDLISAVVFVPLFTLPGLFIAAIGMYVGSKYLKAQLSVRREMSNAKAPMLAHFGAAMSGLVTLRAYGVQAEYRAELRKRVNQYVRLSRMNYDLNRWINVRIDYLGAIFTASLATYLTYGAKVSAANVGFSLNRAVEFCQVVLYVVRLYNLFQVESNSLERIVAYTEIEQEPQPTEQGKPPAAWPTSGDIKVENLTAKYSKTGPAVLHGLTFNIGAGQRVGVVGRTGSGKSSLTLALLRCILTEGSVYFDGLDTSKLNLDALRSNITIIPQIPELLSGTLRYNLDPFDEYDDATLNAALKASGLYASQTDSGENRLTLDTSISGGGSNVSVGQRQIIALARAIIRSSKLLILDEATSAIDHATDNIIQNTLRRELGSDVTVLTIAHRLQTIIDADKIMVLDAGNIVEFASPAELLASSEGIFKALVDESGDKDHLYELVGKRPSSSTS